MYRYRPGLLAIIVLLTACSPGSNDEAVEIADTIFVGANIITMADEPAVVTGVAVLGETILATGSEKSVRRHQGEMTRIIDLGETALLPGFIDSHGHFAFTSRMMKLANLSSPPVGTATDIQGIVTALKEHAEANAIADGDWIVGYGYDDSLLEENRHPTRDDLDRVSATHPVLLLHVSGHLAATNSLALELAGFDSNSEDPPGGVIRRRPGSSEPDGVLEEKAASRLAYQQIASVSGEKLESLMRAASSLYAGYGITTVQDGATSPLDLTLLRQAAARRPFDVDIAVYQTIDSLDGTALDAFAVDANYAGGVRLAGVKISLDGSPQGRTAWLTEPYAEGPPGAAPDYVAYPTMQRSDYEDAAAKLIEEGIPVLVHANGDAAIDLMLDGVEVGLAGAPHRDHRSVIIHAQLMREDQVKRAAELGAVPSFFSAHAFYWGDWHRRSFGDSRAQNISPARWAVDYGVPFTLHNDAPVVPPDMARLLWATVTRKTRSGVVLGPKQRLSTMEALHALTLGGAYQLFEEDRKGSLLAGKQADMVILDANPLSVSPAELQNLKVLETFSRGRSVYKASAYGE